jgi:hypothetical protein
MDYLQLLLASLVILIVCLIVWFNNSMNRVKQPRILKYIALVAVAATVYFYANLDRKHIDCIWGVAGGETTGGEIAGGTTGDDDDDESLIVRLTNTPNM